jgi:hypothetical protein
MGEGRKEEEGLGDKMINSLVLIAIIVHVK